MYVARYYSSSKGGGWKLSDAELQDLDGEKKFYRYTLEYM